MVGPSSSHTAGALRLGLLARALLGRTPERLTPGIIDRHWMIPTPMTVFSGISATPTIWPGLTQRSIARIAIPPRISAQATIIALPSNSSIRLIRMKPRTAEGTNPMRMLRTKRQLIASPLNMPSSTAQKVRQ